MNDIIWEGAELCVYFNGACREISLTNTQFAIVAKILGLELELDTDSVSCFSDETLKRLASLNSNPLKLQ
jgi:hypothetical protein